VPFVRAWTLQAIASNPCIARRDRHPVDDVVAFPMSGYCASRSVPLPMRQFPPAPDVRLQFEAPHGAVPSWHLPCALAPWTFGAKVAHRADRHTVRDVDVQATGPGAAGVAVVRDALAAAGVSCTRVAVVQPK
jgi:hypothetical protein